MKNGNACPKCRSKEVVYVPGGLLEGQNCAVLGTFFAAKIRIARYVCISCGYSEEWVDREDDMEAAGSLYGGQHGNR